MIIIVNIIFQTGSLSLFFFPVFGDIERNLFVNLPIKKHEIYQKTTENIFGEVFFINLHNLAAAV